MAVAERLAPPTVAVDPTLGTCPLCAHDVLIVVVDGTFTALEPGELMETFPCYECARVSTRQWRRLRQCPKCFGIGYLGQPLPPYGVAVAADGAARHLIQPQRPASGEAVYLEHTC